MKDGSEVKRVQLLHHWQLLRVQLYSERRMSSDLEGLWEEATMLFCGQFLA